MPSHQIQSNKQSYIDVINNDNDLGTGHFFQISLGAIKRIIELGGTAEDIISYLVLARHTVGKGEWQYIISTAGANAIYNKTTISYRKATAFW